MNLEQIITLFEDIEAGKQGQMVGYHLHEGIRNLQHFHWTDVHEPDTFSGFLKALRNHEPIQS